MAPEEVRKQVVHGDQDILISAPIEAGMELRPGRRSRRASEGVGDDGGPEDGTRDGDGQLLNEQYVVEFYRRIVARRRRRGGP